MSEESARLRFAFYWCASCGGCDVAVLDINERILDLANTADIYLWPVLLDFKYDHLSRLEDGFLDVAFVNGSIRNSEQEEIVRLLRSKSRTVVAFGSCACFGGIPALANLFEKEAILQRVYLMTESCVNPTGTLPLPAFRAQEGTLELPAFHDTVRKLDDVIPVEYFLPGCPPPPELVVKAVEAIVSGQLPLPGSVLAPEKAVCDSCNRSRQEKKVKKFVRLTGFMPDPERCLLEQGVVCCGPATRDGCGARCLNANMPCRGCFGPTPGALEQGASLASAIATMVDAKTPSRIEQVLAEVVDPVGTFYQFSLSSSLLRARRHTPKRQDTREWAAS